MSKDVAEHWKEMPEFVQENKQAIKRVTINFLTKEDIELFNKVTGLNITMKTKGVFFPTPSSQTDSKVYVKN